MLAKKEDKPEQALREFRTIIDQETEKGDWYAVDMFACTLFIGNALFVGVSKHSSSRSNSSFFLFTAPPMH